MIISFAFHITFIIPVIRGNLKKIYVILKKNDTKHFFQILISEIVIWKFLFTEICKLLIKILNISNFKKFEFSKKFKLKK